jgi:hypothetical protein
VYLNTIFTPATAAVSPHPLLLLHLLRLPLLLLLLLLQGLPVALLAAPKAASQEASNTNSERVSGEPRTSNIMRPQLCLPCVWL